LLRDPALRCGTCPGPGAAAGSSDGDGPAACPGGGELPDCVWPEGWRGRSVKRAGAMQGGRKASGTGRADPAGGTP